MSNYTFTFKKDDIFVEFTTTEKEVVENQFQIWVTDATAYNQSLNKDKDNSKESKIEKKTEKEKITAKTEDKKQTKATIKEAVQPIDATVEQENEQIIQQNVEIIEPIAIAEEFNSVAEPKRLKETFETQEADSTEKQQTKTETEENTEVFDKASTLLKTINTIQSEETNEPQAPEMPSFESILEDSIENSSFEPVKTKDGKFLQIINLKNTQDKFHYLIITANYLSEFEKLERFTLKQINAKLMHNLSQVIDHTVLQDAINSGYIEIVPDLTGFSDASEYRLTDKGENFYLNEI